MKQKQCFLLQEEGILKDAAVTEYCALCSMAIKAEPAGLIPVKQRIKYFCSKKCHNKFKAFMQIATGAIKQ